MPPSPTWPLLLESGRNDAAMGGGARGLHCTVCLGGIQIHQSPTGTVCMSKSFTLRIDGVVDDSNLIAYVTGVYSLASTELQGPRTFLILMQLVGFAYLNLQVHYGASYLQ